MPGKIQRNARGLEALLSLQGSPLPIELEDRVRGMVDLLQLYAGSQGIQVVSGANAALAENGAITITPSTSSWTVLFAVSSVIVKTATATAFQASYSLSVNGGLANAVTLFNTGSLTPFGATETGAVKHGFVFPFPRLVPPGTQLNFVLDILGTDATANCSITAQFGQLG